MRRLLIPGLIAALSVPIMPRLASTADMPIVNADFGQASNAIPGWGWWSRTEDGSMTLAADQGHDASPAVRIENVGDRDFAFSSETRFDVTPGQWYRATAWVQLQEGNVQLCVVGLKGKELVDWRLGAGGTTDADRGNWTQLSAPAFIPEGCDTIYVRFVGMGPTKALIDDVAVGPWERTQADLPKVEGFAKERVTETLDRGLVARRLDDETVYLSWRLLESDPDDVGFEVSCQVADADGTGVMTYRHGRPIVGTTDFLCEHGPPRTSVVRPWTVTAVTTAGQAISSQTVHEIDAVADAPVQTIKLVGDHTFQKVGIGDLDGDGRYDYVIKQPRFNVDPYVHYWKPSQEPYTLEAYDHAGEAMWQIDLGWAIETGIWYSPYLVYDFDGDGKAEVVAKTGEGDPRDADGRVHSGPEYVTVFDGETGKPICQRDWIPREGFGPGGNDYNRACRNQLGVAYLDGKTPCLIVQRGTYDYMVAVAYQLRDGRLEELWRWDNADLSSQFRGQGAHWMHAADVDDDGRDEVILGSITLDDDGSFLWTTGLGHPDHAYVGDIDPSRPGLEIYYGIETRQRERNGMCLACARTGEILWGHDRPTKHIHSSGLCSDIDAAQPGWECYSGERDTPEDRWLRDCKGNILLNGDLGGLSPRPVFWDADLQREILRGSRIVDYPEGVELGRIDGRLVQVADVLGDWREELIVSTSGELRIYMTTIPAAKRLPCLMQDPIYRIDAAHGAMGYTQVPMLSYDPASRIGE